MTRNLFRETSSAPLGNVKSATGGRPLGSCGHILGLSVCGQWLRHLSGSFLQHFMVRQGSESHGGLACSMPLPGVGGWVVGRCSSVFFEGGGRGHPNLPP